MNWECDRCGTIHTQNPSECRDCGHQILRPISDEEVSKRSGGIDSPDAVSDIRETGSTVEPEFESSPDMNPDGSLAEQSSSPETDPTRGGAGSGRQLMYKFRGLLLAPFKLLREWIIPITVFLLVFGGLVYLLL